MPAITPSRTPGPGSEFYYSTTIPIGSLIGDSKEEITRKLFSRWLAHFTSEDVSSDIRLLNYRINKISFEKYLQDCVKNSGTEAIATVNFSVQTLNYPVGDWYVPNGDLAEDHWVNNKEWFIAIFLTEGNYTFKILGAPPCIGVAIDGTPIP
jgi:hypothetical protein